MSASNHLSEASLCKTLKPLFLHNYYNHTLFTHAENICRNHNESSRWGANPEIPHSFLLCHLSFNDCIMLCTFSFLLMQLEFLEAPSAQYLFKHIFARICVFKTTLQSMWVSFVVWRLAHTYSTSFESAVSSLKSHGCLFLSDSWNNKMIFTPFWPEFCCKRLRRKENHPDVIYKWNENDDIHNLNV